MHFTDQLNGVRICTYTGNLLRQKYGIKCSRMTRGKVKSGTIVPNNKNTIHLQNTSSVRYNMYTTKCRANNCKSTSSMSLRTTTCRATSGVETEASKSNQINCDSRHKTLLNTFILFLWSDSYLTN